ncbi:MAG: TIR domain-containing protein [Oscillospiraceae bacterium]|nr:TIR domain-containing protein [Oscillospiraceae bacterium]
MALFKCKMCGGALEINNNETVATCEYCGTQQTLPKLDNDKRANLYDRANHFRRNNEFDKAMGIYENILNEDNTDAEAYWSLVLCRYGIEYVEDPSSHKRIPTVNRAQFTSIFDDDNYKSALQYADSIQRGIYEEEAKTINEIQKGILAISQKEEPFDVFICYKETDNNGRRTPDSVLANDLYHQLTQEGFKVFFARITLEDKLGSAYEPYIFAALNSAKVMVVLGTKPEFFNAVWVKNEWARYLALIKQGEKKMLIPAYKDMDPYDLPEEFSHLQAQDMGKLGFMQDLIRGIKKIAQDEGPKTTVVKETVAVSGNANTAPLLKRAFMFLEDGDWSSADEYCEKVLDIDPENAEAYLGKLMAELRVRKREQLGDIAQPFDGSGNYQKILRFGAPALVEEVKSDVKRIRDRIAAEEEAERQRRLAERYAKAEEAMKKAGTEQGYRIAASEFRHVPGYRDADALAKQCDEKAEECRKDAIYSRACASMVGEIDPSCYEKAIGQLKTIPGWKDAEEKIALCKQKIEEIKAREEADRLEKERLAEIARKEAAERAKKAKKIAMITTAIVCAIVAFVIVLNTVIIPNVQYGNAISLMDEGKYTEAISAFEALNGYKDSVHKIDECNTAILDGKYNDAIALMNTGNYDEAYCIFKELGNYKDAEDKITDARMGMTEEQLKTIKVGSYITFGAYEQDNNTSNGKENIEWLVLEKQDDKTLVISKEVLDFKPHRTSYRDVTWESSELRNWLNTNFINTAFSAEEKKLIPTVTVPADKNPEYNTDPGNATQDRVFLLSIAEANKYFSSSSARRCKPSAYVVALETYGYIENEPCPWWLRSPGSYQSRVAYVDEDGDVYDDDGVIVFHADPGSGPKGVRPALWIDLNA